MPEIPVRSRCKFPGKSDPPLEMVLYDWSRLVRPKPQKVSFPVLVHREDRSELYGSAWRTGVNYMGQHLQISSARLKILLMHDLGTELHLEML